MRYRAFPDFRLPKPYMEQRCALAGLWPIFDRDTDKLSAVDPIDTMAPPWTRNIECDGLKPIIHHDNRIGAELGPVRAKPSLDIRNRRHWLYGCVHDNLAEALMRPRRLSAQNLDLGVIAGWLRRRGNSRTSGPKNGA